MPILRVCQCRREIFVSLAESSGSFLARLPISHRDASPGGMQGTVGGLARRRPQDQRSRYFFQRRGNPAESGSAPDASLAEPKHLLIAGRGGRRSPAAGLSAARWKRRHIDHIDRIDHTARGQLAPAAGASPRVCALPIYRH